MALKGVDIDVDEGEIVTLIGANGAGKSTLMMTIFGSPRARERHASSSTDATSPRLPTHEIARLRHRAIAGRPAHLRAHDACCENLQMGAEIERSARISTRISSA